MSAGLPTDSLLGSFQMLGSYHSPVPLQEAQQNSAVASAQTLNLIASYNPAAAFEAQRAEYEKGQAEIRGHLITLEEFVRTPKSFIPLERLRLLEEAVKVVKLVKGNLRDERCVSGENHDRYIGILQQLARNNADTIDPVTCPQYFYIFNLFCNPEQMARAVEPTLRRPLDQAALEQVRVIVEFWRDTIIHYMPAAETSPCQILKQEMLAELDAYLPTLVAETFFQEPRNINTVEKRFILCLLGEFTRFFNLYMQCVKPKASDITDDEEMLFISKLSPNKYTIQGATGEEKLKHLREQMYKNMLGNLQRLVPRLFNKTPAAIRHAAGPRIASLFICMGLLELFDRAFAPATFSLIIGRFIEDMFHFGTMHQQSVGQMDCNDKNFSQEAGDQLSEMGKYVINIGEPRGMIMTPLTGMLTAAMATQIGKRKIGDFFQQQLNQASHDESPWKPCRFLGHILFRNENGRKVPTLLENFPTSPEQQKALQQRVGRALFEKLHPQFKKIVTEQSSLAGRFTQIPDVDNYCKRLIARLYNLSQRELILKVFLGELLEKIAAEVEKA